jgi:hypothetical protein
MRQGREADHTPPSSADVKNGGAIPPFTITLKHSDNFTFLPHLTLNDAVRRQKQRSRITVPVLNYAPRYVGVWGSEDIDPGIHNVSTRCMWVVSFTLRRFSSMEPAGNPWLRGWMGLTAGLVAVARKEFRSCRPYPVTLLTELPWLAIVLKVTRREVWNICMISVSLWKSINSHFTRKMSFRTLNSQHHGLEPFLRR